MGSHQEICVRGVEARQCCSIWCSSKIKPLKEHQRKGPLWQSRQSGNRDRDVRESSKCFEEQSIPTRALIVFYRCMWCERKALHVNLAWPTLAGRVALPVLDQPLPTFSKQVYYCTTRSDFVRGTVPQSCSLPHRSERLLLHVIPFLLLLLLVFFRTVLSEQRRMNCQSWPSEPFLRGRCAAHCVALKPTALSNQRLPKTARQREFCPFADAPSPSLLKHLLNVEGGAAE